MSYLLAVYGPVPLSRYQERQVKQAFYAGCYGMLHGIADIADAYDEDTAAGFADQWNTELEDFNRDVAEGRV